jgi:hypothetical protein
MATTQNPGWSRSTPLRTVSGAHDGASDFVPGAPIRTIRASRLARAGGFVSLNVPRALAPPGPRWDTGGLLTVWMPLRSDANDGPRPSLPSIKPSPNTDQTPRIHVFTAANAAHAPPREMRHDETKPNPATAQLGCFPLQTAEPEGEPDPTRRCPLAKPLPRDRSANAGSAYSYREIRNRPPLSGARRKRLA